MEHSHFAQRRQQILSRLHSLPSKMIAAHEYENLVEFVLYDLSHPESFHLGKAAFFIDNPDFNCMQGIAGISCDEGFCYTVDAWQDRDTFSSHMKESPFNQSVRLLAGQSIVHAPTCEQELTQLAQRLHFTQPQWRTFVAKHGNHGILLYEPRQKEETSLVQEYLPQSMVLLAFCPVF